MIRFVSSDCASVCSSFLLSAVIMRVVSSAYVYTFDFGTVWMMLFMYRRKKVVESVLPCGIPCVMVCVADCACCVCVDCCLILKYDLKCACVIERIELSRNTFAQGELSSVAISLCKS